MEKANRNRMINSLEATKSLITQAQGLLEEGKLAEAEKELMLAFNRLSDDYTQLSRRGSNTSTEHM